MLINVDAKALEWVVCAFLSQDETAIYEIENNIDQHTENQKMLMLPPRKEGRLIAKVFVFRLIYGSVAEGFAKDPDFIDISKNVDFWQEKINKFYKKYKGIELFHEELVKQYKRDGKLTMLTGRTYYFDHQENFNYLRPKILNYPVQGLGHDLMTISRVSLFKKMRQAKVQAKLISTVHDSITIDTIPEEKETIIDLINKTWEDIPENFENLFGVKFNLPTRCEISCGPNLRDTTIC